MSKAPAFQFYPGDWLRNSNLRRCSHAARGAWVDVLCLMHDAEEYGVLRWPLADIAQAAGVPLDLLSELAAKGVLKGGDDGCEPFIYRPRHAGKDGDPVILVGQTSRPCWYSSRFVRDEHVRLSRGKSTQFTPDNQPNKTPNNTPKPPIGVRQGDGASTALASASALAVTTTPLTPQGGNPAAQPATPPAGSGQSDQAGKPAKRKREPKPAMMLTDWLTSLGDEPAIRDDDPILAELELIGVSRHYALIAWHAFKTQFGGKRPQKDWPAHFRNAIRGNWLKVWYFDSNGQCLLTTAGEQSRRAMEAAQ